MDTQPKIPTLKDSQKPQVKIRGLEAGVTLFDRLKQFKKKDLAFILAGLGTLFMAPLAEHFMMSPESGDGQLQQGWGGKGAGGRGMFDGSGSSPYEPGTTGLAPGSAVGGGSDIITPLNVRDPSALVMGPGATQQPPTQSVMPATPPPTAPVSHSDSDLKDALAASARGVGAAAHAAKALLPVPKIALAGSGGLRGLGVVSGGTSATASGGPISSNGLVSGKAASGGGLTAARAPSGFKGVARGQSAGDASGMAALKAAGDAAAGKFNGGSSAYQSATDAAATAIPAGGGALGGGGAGGVGATDKPFGGDQNKDGKNVGESLAFLKQKAMQEAQIALWAKEQEAGDNRLEALKIRNSMAEAFTSKLAGMAADQVGCMINSSGSQCPNTGPGGATTVSCTVNGVPNQMFPMSNVSTKGCTTTSGGSTASTNPVGYFLKGGTLFVCPGMSPLGSNCNTNGATDDSGGTKPSPSNNISDMGSGVVTDVGNKPITDLKANCDAIKALQTGLNDPQNGPTVKAAMATAAPKFTSFLAFAAKVAAVRDATGSAAASGGTGWATNDCGATPLKLTDASKSQPLITEIQPIVKIDGVLRKDGGVVASMDGLLKETDVTKVDSVAKTVVGDGSTANSGVVPAINLFIADAAVVKNAKDGMSSDPNLSAGDPLGLAALKTALNSATAGKGDQQTAAAQKAVGQIQSSAKTLGLLVDNLSMAANNDLKPMVQPAEKGLLTASFGDKGSLKPLVGANKAVNSLDGKDGMPDGVKAGLQLPAAGKDESLSPSALTPDAIAAPDQQNADATIKTAQTSVQKFLALPPDQQKADVTAGTTQGDIDKAGKAVRQVQADQGAIDTAIKNAASMAASRVGLGN